MSDVPWPADSVERRALETIYPYARNAKTHSDRQVDQIAAGMREWGWTFPILLSEDGTIIAGHGRVLAAKKLGLTSVPVMVAVGWSEAKCQAYRLADNRLAESPWDAEMLSVEMKDLADKGVDLSLLGFDPREIATALTHSTPVGNCDPDEAPGIPKNPKTRAGDVWVLESGFGLIHRIVCGDCTDSAVVGACLRDVQPLLMVTDPPYGVKYDANWRNQVVRANGSVVGKSIGARAVGKVSNDDRADWREAWALFPGYVAYVWHAGLRSAVVQSSLEAVGFSVRSQIVWVKSHFAIGRGNYHLQHEAAYYVTKGDDGADNWQRYDPEHEIGSYAVRKGKTADWQGGRKQSTVWFIDKNKASETGHSTQKPVECMRRPILNNSSPGQAVYEPFSGSGTTIIAGEMTGRPVCAVELEPAYVDVAVARWCKYAGRVAVREGDGLEWDGTYEGEA